MQLTVGPNQFFWKADEWSAACDALVSAPVERVVLGELVCSKRLPFYQDHKNQHWLNPGVIGMPANDGNTEVWYAILDDSTESFNFDFRRLTYNFTLTNKLMRNGLLPESYAKTIVSGIWDNMEILPDTEKQQQGKSIPL
jgi:hypothetical protein